ncbi:MAG TPA: T9SS type A sorting domain-containing protein [Puia sp.]|nr:T9SS type A sorting domain-containing protein [Puia sp.]
MKKPTLFPVNRYIPILCSLAAISLFSGRRAAAQSCAIANSTSISTYPNTYYPATASASAGSKNITLGSVSLGTVPISSGDVLLVIQMQGAQYSSNNSVNFGDGMGTGKGYYNNSFLMAGQMEYVIASNSVPLTGGTLNITTGLTHSYQNSAVGTYGQYTFQIIRVPVYNDLVLTGTITAPRWDGSQGGVVVLFAIDNINLNGQKIDASGLGFRGGGGRSLTGAGTGSNNDYMTRASRNANGSKGEGIAGTPKYTNNNNTSLDVISSEGYPSGSYARGAPGNAGGGGTDGNPNAANDQNTGGGGGSNGGAGGQGGNSWSTNIASGGLAGAAFAQVSASRLVMGGGGGAGTTNNGTGTPGSGLASSGSAGGGIVILIAQNAITGTGTVDVSGSDANATVQNDGAGGAGAGGSALIYSANGTTSNVTVLARGGNGGINQGSGGSSHGPGGGGGGGVIYSNASLNAASTVAGGSAGTTAGGTTNYGATSGSTGKMVTNMSAASMAQISLSCVVLAAGFTDVTARPDNGVVNVGWSVADETGTTGYVVERSSDGVHFDAIGNMPVNGTGTDNGYQYTDNTAEAVGGTLYYRIRATETGSHDLYSRIVSVALSPVTVTGKLTVFPNPAKSIVTVSFTMTGPRLVHLGLFDQQGSMLWERQYQASAGRNSLQIDKISSLPDGIYLLQSSDGLNLRVAKVFVQH